MHSRDRIEAALSLEVGDHPPVGAWGHSYDKEWSVEDLAKATIDAQRHYGWDFVKFQPRATCFAEAFGASFHPSGSRLKAPIATKPSVVASEDWSRLPKVDASAKPLADQIASLGIVASKLGPGIPVLQTVFSPLTIAGWLAGIKPDASGRLLRDDPATLVPALERIAAAMIDFSLKSIDAGAAGIFFAISGFASQDAIPLDVYNKWVLPHDQMVLDSLPHQARFNVVHLCGARIHFDLVPSLRSQVVSWAIDEVGNPTLEEGIEKCGRAAMGGVAQRTTLVNGPPMVIADEVKAATNSNDGRGVIVAPGCSVPPEAPEANLRLMADLIRGNSPDAD